MAGVVIEKRLLEDFDRILQDVVFDINSEIYLKECDKTKVHELLDYLKYQWGSVYDPNKKAFNKSLRVLYSQYIKAKKEGRTKDAANWLDTYLALKNKI